jgi:hypothetical protein
MAADRLTYIVDKPTTFRRYYETASWYTDIEVEPGEYPARLVRSHGDADSLDEAQWVIVRMPGVIVGDFFVNRLLWAESAKKDEGVGRPDTYGMQTQPYLVRKALAEGDPHWRLDDA